MCEKVSGTAYTQSPVILVFELESTHAIEEFTHTLTSKAEEQVVQKRRSFPDSGNQQSHMGLR